MKYPKYSINELYEEINKITNGDASYLLLEKNGINVTEEKIIDETDYTRILESVWLAVNHS